MALIICTECGKKFSDQAAACPECGCPIQAIKTASAPVKTPFERSKASRNASNVMMSEVAIARREARSAEATFASSGRMVRIKANRTVDLFSGDAIKYVSDIADAVRKMSDKLYTTLQNRIAILDKTCRPLLADEPSKEAVREVAECIKTLNEKSEIKNDYTASVNSTSLGGVGSVSYVPSIESKMIQSFWESQIATAKSAARLRAELETPAEREARLKEEAEQKEIAKQLEEEKRAYNTAVAKYKQDCADVNKRRSDYVQAQLDKRQRELIDTAAMQRDEIIAGQSARKAELEAKLSQEQQKLASLGIFKISEKKACKTAIESMTAEIAACEEAITAAGSDYEDAEKSAPKIAAVNKEKHEKEAQALYCYPAAPQKPQAILDEENAKKDEHDKQKMLILDLLSGGCEYTSGEIKDEIPEFKNVSYQLVNSLLQELKREETIERFEQHRKAYWRI